MTLEISKDEYKIIKMGLLELQAKYSVQLLLKLEEEAVKQEQQERINQE